MCNIDYDTIDLQLFADGAGTGGAGTAAPADGTAVEGANAGESDEAAPAQETDPEAEFDALIRGKYKTQYDRRVQGTVKQRLKGRADAEARLQALDPVLDALGMKYGVDASDAAALTKAVDEDESWWADESMRTGIPVAQLKEGRRMARENAELRAQLKERETRERVDAQVATWVKEAKAFPELDLRAELDNPRFIEMMQLGVGLEAAYYAVHHKELVRKAAEEAKQAVAVSIAANRRRPAENGTAGSTGASYATDVSHMSKADRQALIRRVAAGERIVL